jgi:predicted nuclease of predicted toxin-antitoxin system
MGTLTSELRPIAARLAAVPRVYVDANVPTGIVSAMRQELCWDVLFVLEHADLRRARDAEHYRQARECGRTLITLDRDFANDRRFPVEDSPGVIICSAPDARVLLRLMRHVDRAVLRAPGAPDQPLRGRKIVMTPDVVPE